MITLETLRAVLTAADPYDGIDRLIRAELDAGRTTKAVHGDLFPLVREARRTPGLTEDADEALLGALDALTGNCHPDCRYQDPKPAAVGGPDGQTVQPPLSHGTPGPVTR